MAENDNIFRFQPPSKLKEFDDLEWNREVVQALRKELSFSDELYNITKELPSFCRRFINSDRLFWFHEQLKSLGE